MFMLRNLKDKILGVVLKVIDNKHEYQFVVVTFVDDVDFCTDGKDAQEKVREIVDYYVKIFKVNCRILKDDKIAIYGWK